MKFQIIGSGSKGNMTYIEANDTRILLDAGINLKEINRRSEIDFEKIDALLITHEHSDHISSLLSISKKLKCKIYINKKSFEALINRYPGKYDKLNVKYIEANEKYKIKNIAFMPILLSHDTANCFGFVFVSNEDKNEKECLSYITDTGFIPVPYLSLLSKSDSIIIEANHDIEMLQNSDRDWTLKQRILSVTGHMSNLMCGEVVNKLLKKKKIDNVILAHLSEECNTEELAVDTILNAIDNDYLPTIYVSKQHESLPFINAKGKNDD